MTAGVPLIDLDRPPPAPVESARHPRARPLLVPALLAVLLFVLGGAVPARNGLTPVLSVAEPVTSAQLGARSLFLSTTTEVRRYELPAGRRSWTRPVAGGVQNLWLDDTAGILLALGADGDLIAFEAESGRSLWSAPRGQMVVLSVSRGGVLVQTGPEVAAQLTVLDSRTGRPIWSHGFDPAGFLGPEELFSVGSPRIVMGDATGRVTVLSYADGSVLAGLDLDLNTPAAGDRAVLADFASVSMVGDRLYLSRRLHGKVTMTAYSVQPMAAVWQNEGGPTGTVTDCGPVLCVADTRWVSAVDPAGGGLRWQQPSWGIAYRYDADRLFAYDNQEDPRTALLDARTGRLVLPLGHSRRLGDLLLRTEGTRTWVSVRDPATGDLRIAGSMADVASFRCQASGDYLLCPTLTGDTSVWRVG